MRNVDAGERPAVRPLRVALVCGLIGVGVLGCSSSANDAETGGSGSGSPLAGSAHSGRKAILIKTSFTGFDGKVVEGSVIGDSPFCASGTLHHEPGSPDIGYPAVNVFTCGASQLRIGFGPGPEQMNNRVQTSDWKVLGGSGDFAGATGSGHMRVEFPTAGASSGQETFTGTVLVPHG